MAHYSTATNQVLSGITPSPIYDANGNQTNLTSHVTSELITWNAANQPVSIDGITATYDALGRIVETGSGSSYQQFVFRPSGAILAVYNAGTSSLVKGTIPLPGGETAIYNSSGLNYIRHTDWLGSSRFSTTWGHAVYAKESYAPFGETYNEAGTADRSYTGQDQDVVSGSGGTGVYDFLYRKHDPSAGRWLSPDPAGWTAADLSDPQSLNRYAYVGNRSLNTTDPLGLVWNCFPVATEGGYTYLHCVWVAGSVQVNGNDGCNPSVGGINCPPNNPGAPPPPPPPPGQNGSNNGNGSGGTGGPNSAPAHSDWWYAYHGVTDQWTADKKTCQQLNKYAADLQNIGIGGAIGGAKAGVWGSIEGAIPAIGGNLISRWTATHCD